VKILVMTLKKTFICVHSVKIYTYVELDAALHLFGISCNYSISHYY
jgi:hypothetical protein